MNHPDKEDPLVSFMRTYTIKDAIMDIGASWDNIDDKIIHKCFKPILETDSYIKAYNDKNGTAKEWPGDSFLGFNPKVEKERKEKANILLDLLMKQILYSFTLEDIQENIEYDPNQDVSVDDVIEEGFHHFRIQAMTRENVVEGAAEDTEEDDMKDVEEISRKKALEDTLKVVLNLQLTQGK